MSYSKRTKTTANGQARELNSVNDTPIFLLNDDCMRHVLSLLPIKERIRAQRVCKTWKRLSKLPWTDKKKLNIYGEYFSRRIEKFVYTLPIMKQVLRLCGSSLIELKLLHTIERPPTAVLKIIKQFCPNLRSLDLSGIKLTDSAAKFLAQNFKNLTSVHMGQCKGYDDTFYHDFFLANTKLKTLAMRSDTLSGWCLKGLPRNSIETIEIVRCDKFSAKLVLNALKKLKKLRTLSLIYCCQLKKNLNTLLDILSEKSNFENLEITDLLTSKTDASIIAPNFSKLVNLKKLSLEGNTLLHDEALKTIGAHCKKLSSVSLIVSAKVTDQQLQIFLESLPIEDLRIGKLEGLSETCFDSVHMPLLKSLKFHEFSQLTNANVLSVLHSSYKLECLEIILCENVDYTTILFDAPINSKNRSKILELRLGMDNVNREWVIELSPLRIVYTKNDVDFF